MRDSIKESRVEWRMVSLTRSVLEFQVFDLNLDFVEGSLDSVW